MKGVCHGKTPLDRVVKLVGTKEIVEILAGRLSWADLQTLMMFAYEKRIRALSVAEVSRNHNGNRLSEVANVDPRDLLAVDQLLYRSLPEAFLPLELSPVNPIGANYFLQDYVMESSSIPYTMMRRENIRGDTNNWIEDNNPENLQLMTKDFHNKLHRKFIKQSKEVII